MSGVAVMQGRLLPPIEGRIQCFPRDGWADEFGRARDARVDGIEWIYDQFGADANPIGADDGIEAMLTLSKTHAISLRSVCADYFMDWPLVRARRAEAEQRLGVLRWLMSRCRRLGVERIVIPFVDASAIRSDSELEQVSTMVESVLDDASTNGVELHLETSLGPEPFARLLARLPASLVRVNYDIGNSASLGFDPREEFAAYGERVGSVHVKDRVKGGGTVPLGSGDADFPAVFECLRARGYDGDFVLQVARGTTGDEVDWVRRQCSIVTEFMMAA